jgi:hypothetical protein
MKMKINFTSNKETMYINTLVYGRSKVGKTRLISTCESPLILNVENSVVSLLDHEIPMVDIKSVRDFSEVMAYLTKSEDAKQYKTICLDSVSELAELILAEEKARTKDGRMAYGNMQDEIFKVVRGLISLPFDCYVIAKAEKAIGLGGETIFSPYIPSAKGAMRLPYLFDETFALRKIQFEGDKEAKTWLQCNEDVQWEAGDKSGKLNMWEEPDLGAIFNRIRGGSIDDARTIEDYTEKLRKLYREISNHEIDREIAEISYNEVVEAVAGMGLNLPSDVKKAMEDILSEQVEFKKAVGE